MRRGDIYELRANPRARGHEQRGRRYVVLVQSDSLMLSTVIAAPTSTGAWTSSFHPEVEFEGQRSRVLLEQLQAIDPERRLGRYVGRVSAEQQQEIDHARSPSCSGSSEAGTAGPSLVFQDQVDRQALAAGAGSQTARMVTPVSPARRVGGHGDQ